MIKKGFIVNLPTTVQQLQVQSSQPFARKGTTSGLGTDFQNRQIPMQITNNNTNPNENVQEVFSTLSSIGYPPQESIERVNIQCNVTIKIQNNGKASEYVSNVVSKDIVNKFSQILERNVNTVGIRISSAESFTDSIHGSPFLIMLEPLYTDPQNSKMVAQLTYVTNSGDKALDFLKNLYDRLKKIIQVLGNERQ